MLHLIVGFNFHTTNTAKQKQNLHKKAHQPDAKKENHLEVINRNNRTTADKEAH